MKKYKMGFPVCDVEEDEPIIQPLIGKGIIFCGDIHISTEIKGMKLDTIKTRSNDARYTIRDNEKTNPS